MSDSGSGLYAYTLFNIITEMIRNVKIRNLYDKSYFFCILLLPQLLAFILKRKLQKLRIILVSLKYIYHGFS